MLVLLLESSVRRGDQFPSTADVHTEVMFDSNLKSPKLGERTIQERAV